MMASSSGQSRSIVIAMDGSEHAEHAFNWFIKNCHKEGDKVIVVFCAEYNDLKSSPVTLMSVDPHLITNLIDGEEKKVKELASKFEALIKGNKVDGKIVRVNGEPGHGICQVANDEKATMIVTGTRGLGKIRRKIMGSVSEYVTHHAHVPVLVVRNPH